MKILKYIGITLGALLIVGVSAAFLAYKFGVFTLPDFNEYKLKTMQTEAKSGLLSAYIEQQMHQAENETYAPELPEDFYRTVASVGNPRYRIGMASSADPNFSLFCPDCVATRDTFKLVAYGNIDEDETYDVWVIDQDKKLVNVQNDVTD